MAKIWPVYAGNEPTIGLPWDELPLAEAIGLFELRPRDYVAGLDSPPRFPGPGGSVGGFRHVVVEVGPSESRKDWRPGFYISPIRPDEAFARLISRAAARVLGSRSIVHTKVYPATDSQGRATSRLRIIVTPETVRRLKDDAALNAFVSVRKQLARMLPAPPAAEEGTPIIEFMTEAELVGDDSP